MEGSSVNEFTPVACLCYQNVKDWIHEFANDRERLTNLAVILISVQIGFSLLGSLGILYDNGVSLINLGIALFGLSAIASGNQSLRLTYAVLLFCAILFDITWFIFFSHRIWRMYRQGSGIWFNIARSALAMEFLGFCTRLFSSLVWIQMYRLPVTHGDTRVSRGIEDPNAELRRRFHLPSFSSNDASGDDDSGGFGPADTNFNIEDPELLSLLRGHRDGVRRNDSASGAENQSDSRQVSHNDSVDAIASASDDPTDTNQDPNDGVA